MRSLLYNRTYQAELFSVDIHPPGHKLYKKFPQSKGFKAPQRTMCASVLTSVSDTSATTADTSHLSPAGVTFTPDQYTQILRLLELSAPNLEPTANLAGTVTSLMSVFASNDWILDSGANAHISGTSSGLQNLQPCPSSTGSVRLPNGNSTPILSSGSLQLSLSCTLTNVLHVPDFNFNLLSISQFTKANHCCVVLYPTFCLFRTSRLGR